MVRIPSGGAQGVKWLVVPYGGWKLLTASTIGTLANLGPEPYASFLNRMVSLKRPELTEELNKALAERDRKKGLESRAA